MEQLKLGSIITDKQERDAIHIAVIPITVTVPVRPGHHVNATGGKENPIGVIDPYLPASTVVQAGQTCWLFLYPGSITSLRHEWTHPAIDKHQRSIKWLTEYAEAFDMPYEALMHAVGDYVDNGEYIRIGFDTPERAYDIMDQTKFWMHYQLVTGKKIPMKTKEQGSFFSCAC